MVSFAVSLRFRWPTKPRTKPPFTVWKSNETGFFPFAGISIITLQTGKNRFRSIFGSYSRFRCGFVGFVFRFRSKFWRFRWFRLLLSIFGPHKGLPFNSCKHYGLGGLWPPTISRKPTFERLILSVSMHNRTTSSLTVGANCSVSMHNRTTSSLTVGANCSVSSENLGGHRGSGAYLYYPEINGNIRAFEKCWNWRSRQFRMFQAEVPNVSGYQWVQIVAFRRIIAQLPA